MKTRMHSLILKTSYILSAVVTLSLQPVLASGTGATNLYIRSLAPATPAVADFTDADGAPVIEINMATLAPVTPKEAEFGDEPSSSAQVVPEGLAPSTPKEASFE